MLVPFLFRIEISVKLLRAGGPDFETDLGFPKDDPRFEDEVASNDPAAKTCWVNGVSQDCTCSLGKMVRPARRTSVENFCVASWQVVPTETVSC